MQLSHRFTVPVSVQETWQAFNDLEQVAPASRCHLTSSDARHVHRHGQGQAGADRDAVRRHRHLEGARRGAGRAVIEGRGKDKRGNGTASALVTAQLSADASGTRSPSTPTSACTGKPAQFGRGVLQDVSDKLARTVRRLPGEMLAAGAPSALTADADPVAPPPTTLDRVRTPPGAPQRDGDGDRARTGVHAGRRLDGSVRPLRTRSSSTC
jgi:carbon monoxide dehydrogenase subunit G